MVDKLDFKTLWRSHPLNHSTQLPCRLPKEVVEGGKTLAKGLPSYHNQCAIRMGVALKGAGIGIDQIGRVATCSFHDRQEMHVLNAQQLADAIGRLKIGGLGPLEKIVSPDTAAFYPKIFGRKGIIFFKDYWSRTVSTTNPDGTTASVKESSATGDHIDLWNGYRASAAWLMEWFSWLGYYSNYADSKEIWFWEVT